MAEEEVRRPRRGRIVAGLLLVLLGSASALLWSQRTPIARSYVDDALAAKGVPASYEITRFGVTSQRLENIRIGDPAAPDLTADWAELRLTAGLGGVSVRSISASGVRLRGRLVHGKVSFGAVDRLLPPPTGAPFTLPDLAVNLSDARMRLETPAGVIGLAIEGEGNLADGFQGRLAAVSHSLAFPGCTATNASAFVNIAIADRRPALDGPLRAGRIVCPQARLAIAAPRLAVDVALSEAFDHWGGAAVVESGAGMLAATRVDTMGGRIDFDGGPARVSGGMSLFAGGVRTASLSTRRATIDGRYALALKRPSLHLVGEMGLAKATVDAAALRTGLARLDGSPLGPVGRALGEALARAAGDLDARATIALVHGAAGGALRIERLDANSSSGGRLIVRGGANGGGITYYWPFGATRFDGELLMAGGGLPDGRLRLHQPRADLPMTGEGSFAPYQAGGARIALGPLRFGPGGGGATHLTTRVTIDGPLGDGRVEGLSLPLDGLIGAYGSFVVNPRCVPLDFARLRVAGINLGRSRLPLCPSGGALVARSANGPLRGGARIAGLRLTGDVGDAPLTIAARSLGVEIGQPGFVADAVAVRLGKADALTRLDLSRLDGNFGAGGVGGRFAGAIGNIGAVPLLLSEGAGDWRLVGGVLTMAASMRVADSAVDPRFYPLISRDVRLKLADGVISATGRLLAPASGADVTDVTLRHDLATGRGNAILDVPGIKFTDALQPDALTRLTLGMIANVGGTVAGRGEIRWTPKGVTSDGAFRTSAMDFAAAFGPVKGLAGEIRFTDLLGLETAPGQSVTLADVNPGIAVTGGVIRYQLLPDQRVKVEGGRWPFSGGELLLHETILDMGRPSERRLTFRIIGMDAALFIEQFGFKNIAVTGVFDGVLPMVFDVTGGRIVGGRLEVRRGGGTLAYVGEVSNADLGAFAKLAFDALKSMRYENLAIELNGSLDGEIVSKVLFNGVNEAPVEGGKAMGRLQQLTGLPFKFNITIKAPFRSLVNSAQSLSDPRGLISQALPSKTELPGSGPGVQPPIQPPIQP